jgi:hypothetical protein
MEIKKGQYYRARGRSDIVCVVANYESQYVYVCFVGAIDGIRYHLSDFVHGFKPCPEYLAIKQFDEDLEKLLNEV